MVAVGLSALLAAGVAGCGGSGAAAGGGSAAPATPPSSADGARVVRTAYATTLRARTADVFFRETIESPASGDSQSSTGTGAVDFSRHAFQMTMNLPTGGSIAILLIGTTEYMQIPAVARAHVPGHTRWVSIDLNRVAEAKLGGSLSQLSAGGGDDPTQVLAQLSAVSDRVTVVGHATVDGVDTTEYRAQVDLAKAIARARSRAGAAAARLLRRSVGSLGSRTVPMDLWIGPDHLVRRFQETLVVRVGPRATGGSLRTTLMMDLYRYGAPVHLSAPPRGEVTDLTGRVLRPAGWAAR
jgi:hypothetical protein